MSSRQLFDTEMNTDLTFPISRDQAHYDATGRDAFAAASSYRACNPPLLSFASPLLVCASPAGAGGAGQSNKKIQKASLGSRSFSMLRFAHPEQKQI